MPKYWKACDVLLKLQGQSLSDWIAEDEAKIAEAVIHKWMTALQYSVRVKIKSSQQKFQARYPESSMQRESLEQQEQQKQREASQPVINAESLPCPYPYKLVVASEITKSERCPACGFQDILACKRIHSVVKPAGFASTDKKNWRPPVWKQKVFKSPRPSLLKNWANDRLQDILSDFFLVG